VINNYDQPKNIKELRSFLGMCNNCREFVKNYACMVDPLYKLLKGKQKKSIALIEWGKEEK
jgi:hypothetical protein